MEDPNRPNYTNVNTVPARSSGNGGILFALGAIVVALGVIFWLMTGTDDGPAVTDTADPAATAPAAGDTNIDVDATAPAPAATETAPATDTGTTGAAPATGTDTGTGTAPAPAPAPATGGATSP